MKLSIILVALLSALGSCDRFVIDNMAVKETFWHQAGLPWTGTGCRVWVKHGNNGAISRLGLKDATDRPGWSHHNLHYFEFPSSHYVSKGQQTYLWISCDDALLIDYMQLQGSDGTKTWGSNNAYAWCLSTDAYDGTRFNQESQKRLDWNVISMGVCYSTLRMDPNGQVWGWNGWRPTYWETSTGRRMLDDAEAANLPSTAEVDACVDDESRSAEECDDLVDQILSFEMEHPEGFHRAVQFPTYEEDIPDIDVGNTDTETATDDRRVLSALRKLLKA